MITLENIRQQITAIMTRQHGDFKLPEHPQLIKDAAEIGMSQRDLSQLANSIAGNLDWKIYEVMDDMLTAALDNHRGVLRDSDVHKIIGQVKDKLAPESALSYLIDKVIKLGLKPRDRIIPDWASFKNPWMTDEAWRRAEETTVVWLDENASTLEKMGEISYRKIVETKHAIRNTNALPPLVTLITKNSSKNEEYVNIIQDEPDLAKRYLRVLYHLNPSLPYRFEDKEYTSILALLQDACATSLSFWSLATAYRNKHIHIWLQESGQDAQKHLTDQGELTDFLSFLYKIDGQFPFYLGDSKFDTPLSLAADARASNRHWAAIAEAFERGTIRAWLAGTDHAPYNQDIDDMKATTAQLGYFDAAESNKAMVQGFINSVDATAVKPHIVSSVKAISMPALEAGNAVTQVIDLRLANEGFVKATVYMNSAVPGVSIDTTAVIFHSQENNTLQTVTLTIHPLQLVKNKQYEFSIAIESLYENIEIPVIIKAVFPRKVFLLQLAKYALIFALFFGGIRFLMDMIAPTRFNSGAYIPYSISNDSVPFLALLVVVPLLLLVVGLLFATRLIKKYEKI